MNRPLYELERFPDDAWIGIYHGRRSDPRKNRVIILGAGTFVELQKGAEALLGDEAAAVFYEAGIRAGNEAGRNLMAESGYAYGCGEKGSRGADDGHLPR